MARPVATLADPPPPRPPPTTCRQACRHRVRKPMPRVRIGSERLPKEEAQPLDPSAMAGLSLKELREERQSAKDAAMRGPDVVMPSIIQRLVRLLRGTCCFRNCVARDAQTPLTELHLSQPVFALFLLVGLVLVVLITAVAAGLLPASWAGRVTELVVLILYVAASVLCLYVGLVAKYIPTHEELNVALNDNVDTLDGAVSNTNEDADKAEVLEGMTLSWIQDRSRDRNSVKELRLQLSLNTERLWAFQFRTRLLRYLSLGEQQRYKEDSAQLSAMMRQRQDATLAEFEQARAVLLPNGKLNARELRRVVNIVRNIEQRSAYNFLSEVFDELCMELEAAGGHAQSYARIIELVIEKTKSPKWKEAFDRIFRLMDKDEEDALRRATQGDDSDDSNEGFGLTSGAAALFDVVGGVGDAAIVVSKNVTDLMGNVTGHVSGVTGQVGRHVGGVTGQVGRHVAGMTGQVTSHVGGAATGAVSGMGNVAKGVGGVATGVVAGVGDTLGGATNFVAGSVLEAASSWTPRRARQCRPSPAAHSSSAAEPSPTRRSRMSGGAPVPPVAPALETEEDEAV